MVEWEFLVSLYNWIDKVFSDSKIYIAACFRHRFGIAIILLFYLMYQLASYSTLLEI